MKSIVIIGGGIVGLAIARELILNGYKNLIILEKESDIANHQSSRNSGVMHAGLYYRPGSLKSKLSREGIILMKSYCKKHEIKWLECGKIVVAKNKAEEERLIKLFEKGLLNKLKDIEIISSKQVSNLEPYVDAYKAIRVPEESIVNYKEVAKSFLREILSKGGEIKYNSKVVSIEETKSYEKRLKLSSGEYFDADIIISASGLYSDKVSKMLGIDIDQQQIIPFKGEYYFLKEGYKHLVNNLVYPIPKEEFPFLGAHFTKMIDGELEVGPNAVLSHSREGYSWNNINIIELIDSIRYPGLRNFLMMYPKTSFEEIFRSIFKKLFVEKLKDIVPDISESMLVKGRPGIRAQIMKRNGELVMDFDIRIKENIISVLNAPSPAATSSIAIAKYILKYADL